MTLLQPTGVPSMDAINDAITSEIAEAMTDVDTDTIVQSGKALCTPVSADTMVQVVVTFPVQFGGTPIITCSPSTTANVVCFAYPSSESASQFTINFRRSSVVGTNVAWIAHGPRV